MTDIKTGTGNAIKAGQTAVVHYTGWLHEPTASDKKGKKFDSSKDRNEPFRFRLGRGEVIKGWDQGVEGMQVGGHRQLVIPPALGYGQRGAGGVIPPGATLVFDIELLGIE
jgi:FKBP-type peptidyl-prolyl cis-trans isomerase